MSKQTMKKITGLMLAFMTVIMMAGPFLTAHAAGNTTIFLSKRSLAVGDSLSVTVQGSESDTISVSYTGAILSYTGSNNSSTSVSGGTATFTGNNATLNFTAQSEGTAEIIVTASSLTGSSTTVSVSGSGAAAPAAEAPAAEESAAAETPQTETPAESTDNSQNLTAVEAPTVTATSTEVPADFTGDFFIDGVSYVVSERYSDAEIPEGFSKTTLEINGESYNELTNGVIFLVYLKPEDNTAGSGEMYIYDPNTNSAVKMNMVPGNDDYVILLPSTSLPSDRMVQGMCNIGDAQYICYYVSGTEDSGFAYFYGMNKAGTIDWMECDLAEGTMQRANLVLLSLLPSVEATGEETVEGEGTEVEEVDNEEKFDFKEFVRTHIKIIAVIIFVLVVIVLIILNIKVFSQGRDEDVFDDDDDSEDLLRRYAVRSESEDEFEDDGADEEYEDEPEEEPEPKAPVRRMKPAKPVRTGNPKAKAKKPDEEEHTRPVKKQRPAPAADTESTDDVILPKIDITGIEEEVQDKEVEAAANAAKREKRSSEEAMDRLLDNMDIMDLNDI